MIYDMRRFCLIAIALLMYACSGHKAELASLAGAGRWETILEQSAECRDSIRMIDICWQNLALAETGQLVDKAFAYPQAGASGLIPEWGWDYATSMVLSNISYYLGHISMAQKMAFEANVCSDAGYDPAAMEMLVRTNILYGAWEVAEKYVSLLEKDKECAPWASAQRRFLRNDAAVMSDSLYAQKRACIPSEDFVSGSSLGLDELEKLVGIESCAAKALEYLGMICLLDCDLNSFRAFLDEYYGSDALPELHGCFAEAACMISSSELGYWKSVGVDAMTFRAYCDFSKRYDAGLSLSRYDGTFWKYMIDCIDR